MFREFKVGDLFETLPYRGGLQVLTGGNVSSKYLLPGNTPRISVTSQNNGIIGYYEDVDIKSYRVFENAISVSFLGTVFYHPYRASYDMKVHCLRLKDHELRECEALYLVSVLKKLVSIYNYSNQVSSTEIVDLVLSLPVKPGTDEVNYTEDDIDWNYMEAHIRELDAYLKETGLDDYTLTDDEREVLEREPMFKEFEVITLFDIVNTKSIRQSDVREQLQSTDGSIPYITASDKNNAIFAYIDCPQEWIDDGNCIFIGGKTTTVTYQEHDFCSNDSHNLALYLKNEQARTKRIQLYLAAILKKAFATKYQWSNALSKTKIKNETIQLPVKPGTDDVNYTEDDIDWDYIISYARIMEKQVIADVVDYKNEVIATTKGLIKN